MARFVGIVALTALTGALVSGCLFTTEGNTPVDAPYPLRSSPDSLMAQFVWAYENMDLEAYLDCMADSLVFYLDPDEVECHPDLEPGYWSKAVEETIHSRMFDEATGASSIALQLTTTGIDTVSVPDKGGRGVGWEYTKAVDLRLHVGGTWTYWAAHPSVFVIREDPDDVGPNGETLYEIREWREDRYWQRGDRREEMSSWGAIKFLYR